jgi:hypothetical protein
MRSRSRKHRLPLMLTMIMGLLMGLMVVPASATHDGGDPPSVSDGNSAAWWTAHFDDGSVCQDAPSSSTGYTVPAPPANYSWSWLIINAGSPGEGRSDVIADPVVGQTYVNSQTGDVSNVIICKLADPPFEPEGDLTVDKTADGAFDRTVTWDIDKSVDPDSHRLLVGESADSDYEVVVTKTDSGPKNYTVSGNVKITGLLNVDVTITSIVDSIAGATFPDCATPFVIAAGQSRDCAYTAPGDANVTSNTVDVAGYYVIPEGFFDAGDKVALDDDDTANFSYTENLIGFDTVNVVDSVEGDLGETSGDVTFRYTTTFECSERGTFKYPNVATIMETGDNDDALVTVECVVALEACTPGFWGGTSLTNPYTPANQPAWEYLGLDPKVDTFAGKTYNEIFNTRGRNNYSGSLIWHAAAAYLNGLMADAGQLDFPYSAAEVLDLYEAGDKDALAHANEDGDCPFGADFDFGS